MHIERALPWAVVAVAMIGAAPFACTKSDATIQSATLPTDDASIGDAGAGDGASGSDASSSKGQTGEPCDVDSDCLGIDAGCAHERHGVTYPGGQCYSACDPAKSDPKSGRNPDCPSTLGVCNARVGFCLRSCTEKTGSSPCRDGYVCVSDEFEVCAPAGVSECDPTKAGSCPAVDGGARTCVQVGLDPVGVCTTACDFFTQNCHSLGTGCFPNAFGEGTCLVVTAPGGDGDKCIYKNDCKAGFGCAASGVCRPYCGGASSVACTNGKSCVDFSTSIPKATVGLCDG